MTTKYDCQEIAFFSSFKIFTTLFAVYAFEDSTFLQAFEFTSKRLSRCRKIMIITGFPGITWAWVHPPGLWASAIEPTARG